MSKLEKFDLELKFARTTLSDAEKAAVVKRLDKLSAAQKAELVENLKSTLVLTLPERIRLHQVVVRPVMEP
jgi:hypothetical protein